MAEVEVDRPSSQLGASAAAAANNFMGVPASESFRFHRRFSGGVPEYVRELGGDKGRVIEKVLIANNGVGAVKAIRSIRRWAYDVFGDERAITFVVMATPEDLRANAEYIRMGDVIVDVPGGSNNHNYANVTLIVELARLHGVHAVWAGWGHASENPILPDTLARSDPPIKFIGPAGPPMRALGDKIGSTIIAQTAGVPCIAWNGSGVMADYDRSTGSLPEKAYNDATVGSATEALEAAKKVGFPVMIKASEGGGGKGIRMVDKEENVQTAYRQVCGEVPGSPIFIMKLSSNSRHLEVQLLADEYGDAVALNGRDCSVQRRHQKIIEEGPPVAARPDVWDQMEKAAVALAKAVGYTNAGTVEYLYSEAEKKFYFLELNPRLQVEHPVTEMITGVNLPAAQLQVAMGIPLYHIPEIRELYGKKRFEDDCGDGKTAIDFETTKRVPPRGHCIAVRITAENAEAGFKPTSGGIQELNFRSTPSVWGYFSMDSSGSIHEFADSQFGHLFANGADREQARRNMVLALKELSIRGDISTTVDYISKLMELVDFVDNSIDTAWLDTLIKENALSPGEEDKSSVRRRSSVQKATKPNGHLCIVLGAAVVAYDDSQLEEKEFLDLLAKGQLPPRNLLKVKRAVELILDGIKYKLRCTRTGPNSFSIEVDDTSDSRVETNVRLLSDGGYLIAVGGKSHVAYLTSRGDAASGMRMNVAGATVAFSPDYDPTCLRTDVAGKLVKKLLPDGAKAKKGEPYGEIEVMKMFMPLRVEEAGTITWTANEGAAIAPGDLLATLELDNPENVSTAVVFDGDLNVDGWVDGTEVASTSTATGPHLVLRQVVQKLKNGVEGYVLSKEALGRAMDDLHAAATDPALPVHEINEQLSVLSGRIDAGLYGELSGMIADFMQRKKTRFPAEKVVDLLTAHASSILSASDRAAFEAATSALRDAALPYTKSRAVGVPGSERVMSVFLDFLRGWVSTERWFCDGKSYADAVDGLRKAHGDDRAAVLAVCRAHSHLESTARIVGTIIDAIGDGMRVDSAVTSASSPWGKRASVVAGAESLSNAAPVLSDVGSLGGGDAYASVAVRARKILLQESLPSIEQRKAKATAVIERMVELADGNDPVPKEARDFFDENVPIADIFFPLFNAAESPRERIALVEMYARKFYRTQVLKDFQRRGDEGLLKFAFVAKESERVFSSTAPVTSMTDLTKMVGRSESFHNLGDLDRSGSEKNMLNTKTGEAIPPMTRRVNVTKFVEKLSALEDGAAFEKVLAEFPQYAGDDSQCPAGPVNVLYFIVTGDSQSNSQDVMDGLAKRCEELLAPHRDSLKKADIRRVSFIFGVDPDPTVDVYPMPALFTYRAPLDFKEDSLFRNIEPSQAYHLDMTRLAENFSVKTLAIRQTSTGNCHLYLATPRKSALEKDRKANKSPRIFVRALNYVQQFSSAGVERMLVDALNALDLSATNEKTASDNHLFLNLVSDYESVLDPVVVEQVVVAIFKRHSDRLSRLGVAEVEARLACCLGEGSPPITLRMVASNPTGYVPVMNTYIEAWDESGGEPSFRLVGGTKASLACSGDSSWEGLKVSAPYPLTRPFDAQRKAALRASDTLYCYDLPALFEAAVEQQWNEAASKGGVEGGVRAAARPLMVMYTTELVVQKKGGGDWTMADYMSGDLEMVQQQRGAGANDVGMVAWLMELKTTEYPNGRQVVLIANDITHKAGSFGTREDVVFKMASEFARDRRIPRLYVAANSGARIGLAEGVRKAYRVAFKDPKKPENGFEYLYVTKEDYDKLTEKHELIAEPVDLEGQEVYRLTDIIGSEPDLGVENLKGSGLIAGETSAAYNDIFTLTVVLGRTVGIGAYLVRLGQRTIQKTNDSPIILTGYQALNKLMGCDVYTTNDQLGGPGIMYSNGVSHIASSDHLQAVTAAVDWLSFVPLKRGGLLPITDITGSDVVERPIEFTPTAGTPYDPRFLLAGCDGEDGSWTSGFFDRGSFTETLAGWAKTVVVGRARLGGIPMGVIATENRAAEAIKPADPADVKASEAVIQQAGCVWFPNSAYKTAQAINDFRTEDLPLIVFANWRGFSGGQRDMFDEVLKYGSLIVDAFVAYEQPIFVFIPPFAEIRGGAWVVLDASINASVMEMYASSGSARGGVLEANGAASVKYRTKELLKTMHRLDNTLRELDAKLETADDKESVKAEISDREKALLPVYEQISVQFCELHDTPGRMRATGVIEREVEWKNARTFFFWRLRRKLAEFDLRKKMIEAGEIGRATKKLSPLEASALMKSWFVETPGMTEALWDDDKAMLQWMAQNNQFLEEKVVELSRESVVAEVYGVLTAGGNTQVVGTSGIVEGIAQACESMGPEERAEFKKMLKDALQL